jgi:hypothetical protein
LRDWIIAALAAWGVAACAKEDPLPPPSAEGGTGDGESGETGEAQPDPCAVSGGSGGSGNGSGTGGDDDGPPVKFDVGAGNFEFPKTCDEVADSGTNIGCEFWAVDLPNDWQGTAMSPAAADQQFAVVVVNASALEPAQVSVYLGDSDTPVDQAMVEVDQTHEFQLDPQSIDPQANSTDGIAFRIESDVPVTAYQFNPLDNQLPVYSNDASLLFPTHALSDDYAAVTGDAVYIASPDPDTPASPAGAFVSVVATEDDTLVDILPSVALYPGPTEDVLLDRGQVFTVLSDASKSANNLSSTRVIADKPVAVFAGNVATVEPIEALACCADHLEHQMLPFEAWSTGYAIAPPPSPNGGNDRAIYRITSAFDETQLIFCPGRPQGAPAQMQGLQTAVFESSRAFTVKSADPNKPIAVTQFLESNQALAGQNGQPGDPAMISLPAAQQFQTKYVFAVPKGYEANFVTVVARGSGDIELDGEVIDSDAFTDLAVIDGVMHTYLHRSLTDGPHRIEADVPIGITVVGYDTAVSFGFPGGVGLRVIAPTPPQG